ncbi:MAG: hypothetical protein CMC55_00175 [Flavobacteriaceae bacterium]|nr:hypothetical protein [Flavobacteriaceae bacterium]
MRELTKKQKTLLSKWYKEQRLNDCGETNKFRKVMENNDNVLLSTDDLSIEQLEVLEEINDTEILYQNINRFLNDLWAKENE